MVEIINIVSLGISVIAAIYLLYIIITQTIKGLRMGFLLLAIGIVVGVVGHSLFGTLESCEVVSTGLLIRITPIFVLLGSFLILAGSYLLYRTFKKVSGKKYKAK